MNTVIRRRAAALVIAPAMAFSVASCALQAAGSSGCSGGLDTLNVAYQPGLGYANLRLVKAKKMLEKELPGVKVSWRELNSGSAIRDGTMTGDIDIAAGGVGPFIIGRGAGVKWKMISALNSMNLQLMVKSRTVKSLHDLKGDGKIAMPGPDSIQAIVLKKGAQEKLGDPRALDPQILAMGHPDGVQALLAGQIDAHLTSPPFQGQEAKSGAHDILNSYDLFGGSHTFNGIYAMEDFAACHKKVAPALMKTLDAANKEIKNDTPSAARVLSKEIGGMTPKEISEQLTEDRTTFTDKPRKVTAFADFMHDIGLIRDRLTTKDMFFENAATKGGN